MSGGCGQNEQEECRRQVSELHTYTPYVCGMCRDMWCMAVYTERAETAAVSHGISHVNNQTALYLAYTTSVAVEKRAVKS